MTTIDHGRPISLEVQPDQVQQGVKFGITISKDKIQISSNPPSQQRIADEDETIGQVGGEGSQDNQAAGHEITVSNNSSSLAPFFLALPDWDMLAKELDNFQQLLSSMATPPSFVPTPLLSPGSRRAVSQLI